MNETDHAKEYLIANLEVALLKREVEILRSWGNKDCTNMADVAMESDQNYKILQQVIGDIKDSRRLVIPEAESFGACPMGCTAHKHNDHVLGYN